MSMLATLLRIRRDRVKLASGEVVHVRPLTVKQSYVVEQLFGPVAASMAEKGLDSLEVQAEHADALIGIVATAIDKPVSFVENMPRDDFNKLFQRLLAVERDFFAAHIAAAVMVRAKSQKPQQTGQGPSKR